MNKGKALKIGAIALSAALLGGALVYYNFIHKEEETSFEIGKICPDFTVGTYKVEDGNFVVGEDFTLSQALGKVYVLNFWETWCGGCISELPDFNKFYQNYADKGVAVVAIAGNTSTVDTAMQWMNLDGWRTVTPDVDWREFSLTFAIQKEAMEVYRKTGGTSGALPRTVILDQTGKAVYQMDGSMQYEDLEELVLPLLA